jgi:hypothetical protein
LPAAYRPVGTVGFAAQTAGALGSFAVTSNGDVTITDIGTLPLRLAGSFGAG